MEQPTNAAEPQGQARTAAQQRQEADVPATDAHRDDVIRHDSQQGRGGAGPGSPAHGGEPSGEKPAVRSCLERDVAAIAVSGDLTEEARRPLVRAMTDLLLGVPALRRVRLDLRAVSFMNSAGMAVLVQLQRMASPRGIEVALVAPPQVVARPLQLTGLWHRFPILEEEAEA